MFENLAGAFPDFPSDARVWVYAAIRNLSPKEETSLSQAMSEFCSQWTSHQIPVKADFAIYYHRFLVIVADDQEENVGGCGIDKSIHFLKKFGQEHGLDFFNRLILNFIDGDNIESISLNACKERLKSGQGFPGEKVFFHGVSLLAHFRTDWIQDAPQSFLKNFIPAS